MEFPVVSSPEPLEDRPHGSLGKAEIVSYTQDWQCGIKSSPLGAELVVIRCHKEQISTGQNLDVLYSTLDVLQREQLSHHLIKLFQQLGIDLETQCVQQQLKNMQLDKNLSIKNGSEGSDFSTSGGGSLQEKGPTRIKTFDSLISKMKLDSSQSSSDHQQYFVLLNSQQQPNLIPLHQQQQLNSPSEHQQGLQQQLNSIQQQLNLTQRQIQQFYLLLHLQGQLQENSTINLMQVIQGQFNMIQQHLCLVLEQIQQLYWLLQLQPEEFNLLEQLDSLWEQFNLIQEQISEQCKNSPLQQQQMYLLEQQLNHIEQQLRRVLRLVSPQQQLDSQPDRQNLLMEPTACVEDPECSRFPVAQTEPRPQQLGELSQQQTGPLTQNLRELPRQQTYPLPQQSREFQQTGLSQQLEELPWQQTNSLAQQPRELSQPQVEPLVQQPQELPQQQTEPQPQLQRENVDEEEALFDKRTETEMMQEKFNKGETMFDKETLKIKKEVWENTEVSLSDITSDNRNLVKHYFSNIEAFLPGVQPQSKEEKSEINVREMLSESMIALDSMNIDDHFQFLCEILGHLLSISEVLPSVSFENLVQSEEVKGIVELLLGLSSGQVKYQTKVFATALSLTLLANGIMLPTNPDVVNAVLMMQSPYELLKKGKYPNGFSCPKKYADGRRDCYKKYSDIVYLSSYWHHDGKESKLVGMSDGDYSSDNSISASFTTVEFYWKKPDKEVEKQPAGKECKGDKKGENVCKVDKSPELEGVTHSQHCDNESCSERGDTCTSDNEMPQTSQTSNEITVCKESSYTIPVLIKPKTSDDGVWSWREKIRPYDYEGMCNYIKQESIQKLSQQDTKLGENVCHAIVYCFTSTQLESILSLINERGLSSMLQTPDNCGNVPLHLAVEKCSCDAIEIVVSMCPDATEVANCSELTSLQMTFDSRNSQSLKSLLKAIIERKERSHTCIVLQSILLNSVREGYLECLEILLALRLEYKLVIDLNCTDKDGHTAWFYLTKLSSSLVQEALNILQNYQIDDFNLVVFPDAGIFLNDIIPEAKSSSWESESCIIFPNPPESKKKYFKKKGSASCKRPYSAVVKTSTSEQCSTNPPQLKQLHIGSDSCSSENEKKAIHLSAKQKGIRKRVERRIEETRVSTSEDSDVVPKTYEESHNPEALSLPPDEEVSIEDKEILQASLMWNGNMEEHSLRQWKESESVLLEHKIAEPLSAVTPPPNDVSQSDSISTSEDSAVVPMTYEESHNPEALSLPPKEVSIVEKEILQANLNENTEEDSLKQSWKENEAVLLEHKIAAFGAVTPPPNDVSQSDSIDQTTIDTIDHLTLDITVTANLPQPKKEAIIVDLEELQLSQMQKSVKYCYKHSDDQMLPLKCCSHQIPIQKCHQKSISILSNESNPIDSDAHRIPEQKCHHNSVSTLSNEAHPVDNDTKIKYILDSMPQEHPLVSHVAGVTHLPRCYLQVFIQECDPKTGTLPSVKCVEECAYSKPDQCQLTTLEFPGLSAAQLPKLPTGHSGVVQKCCKIPVSEMPGTCSSTKLSCGTRLIPRPDESCGTYEVLGRGKMQSDDIQLDLPFHLQLKNLTTLHDVQGHTLTVSNISRNHIPLNIDSKTLFQVLSNTIQCFLRSYGCIVFKRNVPVHLHLLFGFSQICRHKSILNKSMYHAQRVIIHGYERVISCISDDVMDNVNFLVDYFNSLCDLDHLPSLEPLRGKKLKFNEKLKQDEVKEKKKPKKKTEVKANSSVSTNTNSETLQVTQDSKEREQGSVLSFANPSNPLQVMRSHFMTYSKCCPKHDIQNVVVIGSSCPASEAFGPKRKRFFNKDLRDDHKHAYLNASLSMRKENTENKNSSKNVRYLSHRLHVMSDRPVMVVPKQDGLDESNKESGLPKPQLATEATPSQDFQVMQGQKYSELQIPTPIQSLRRSDVETSRRIDSTVEVVDHDEEDSHYPSIQPLCGSSSSSSSSYMYSVSEADQREHKDRVKVCTELLHAQDYPRIFPIAYDGAPPHHLPPEMQLAYLYITGLAHYKLSNHKESLKYFQKCVAQAEQCGRAGDVTLCCVYMGDIEFAQRKYIEASGMYQKALQHYSRDSVARDFRMVLPTQSALWAKCGSALKNASRIVDSIACYEKSIAKAESKKDKLSAYTSLGNLYQGVGDNSKAVAEYEMAIELAGELQDYVSLGWNHGNIGNAYLGLHQKDKALHHLFKALDMAVEHETTPQAIGRAFNNLGTAYQSLSELDKAEENYTHSLNQAIYGNDIPGQGRVYGNMGNLLMLKKDHERAIPFYTEVMRLSQDKSTVTTAHHNRGCAYYEFGEKKKEAHLQKSASPASGGPKKIMFHGPQFEDVDKHLAIPSSTQKCYLMSTKDLEYVIVRHEENFNSIKGSAKGLSLSVSLFETNSRTFHRMQDSLVNLGKYENALLTAEQSRARTLGELLLNRRQPELQFPLTSPPTLEELKSVVARQSCPVVCLSYTGDRLLGWVLHPASGKPTLNMFEVLLGDKEFDGKSFDYHIRYSLNEVLVEKSYEMYKHCDYKCGHNDPVLKLYELVAKPITLMLKKLDESSQKKRGPQKVIVIPDSYTSLLPLTCLLNKNKFWGDDYYFQLMPSFLTMGVMEQLPTVPVSIPVEHQQMLCVVGNPNIPTFTYNGEEWNLGRLPHATREAQWVSHILNCTPILHEQATKNAVLMRIMNAKVIHLATHGSAAAGFLAFAGMSTSLSQNVDAKQVLLYPEDIERLSISPALVVLSSCDSGRGIVKADGIQGMARAFLLAGAQAILTSLWRVPDESACIFMQFFYQYLVDGVKGTEALHKAILSVRCFSKYSQYIHWSGYQLTGREIQFNIRKSSLGLCSRLESSSVFPRLDVVQKLENVFLNDPRLPTDVQVLRGSPGVKPSEPLIDFIHSHHLHFKGGIFWINCRTPQLVNASLSYITQVLDVSNLSSLPHIDALPSLFVLDHPTTLPDEMMNAQLVNILKKPNVHIVVISKDVLSADSLPKEIDAKLVRGTDTIDIQPLTTIHTTQRLVHSVLKSHHLPPSNREQETFEKLSDFVNGSPIIIDMVSSLLDSHIREAAETGEVLQEFAEKVKLNNLGPSAKPRSVMKTMELSRGVPFRSIHPKVYEIMQEVSTDAHYDSWQVISVLIEQSRLSCEERLLLYCLCIFNSCPIPFSFVTEISSIIAQASHQPHLASSLHAKLKKVKLLKSYAKPVVFHPSHSHQQNDIEFVYIPQFVAQAVWKDMMSDIDKAMALSITYKALQNAGRRLPSPLESSFLLGVCSLLLESYDIHYHLVGKQCYQEVYRLYLELQYKHPQHH